jgi:hypothetical protein
MHLSFHRNIGNVDRILRIMAGILLIYLAFIDPFLLSVWANLIIGLVGAAMIIEGTLAY